MINIEYIDKLIIEYELTEIKEYIHEKIKNRIKLSIDEKEDYSMVGSTRIAGYPDVVEDFEWPKTKNDEYMTFIAQLNMSEISKCDSDNLLPKTGILYFFMGIDEPAYDIEHKVIYLENPCNIKTMKLEETTVLEEDDENAEFISFRARPTSTVDIPNYAYVDCDILDDDESYYAMQEEIKFHGNNNIGSIFGYPEGQHDDAELEAALRIILNEKYNYRDKDKEKLVKYYKGDIEKTDEEINNICMLLELESDNKVGFQWWDCGCIHFFIRKEDLINKDFSKTYLSLYSS